jgi:hypothetical protein
MHGVKYTNTARDQTSRALKKKEIDEEFYLKGYNSMYFGEVSQ